VALVTGAGQGVGRQIAIDLAAEGCIVLVNDLFEERVLTVVEQVTAAGGRAHPAAVDITDADAVNALVAKAAAEHGPVEILVNNAGILPERREAGGITPLFLDTTPEDWAKTVGLNVFGMMNCCHAVLPGMKAGRFGKIINITSDSARVGEARFAAYAAAKAAMIGFAKSLAREHGRDCVNVNVISLAAVVHEGIHDGPLSPDASPETDPILVKVMEGYPLSRGLKRLGRPDDVSGMVAFLASERAAFITGQTVGVNGGFAMV